MAEVLTKAEKYINSEEALLSKQENSAAQKERGRGEKKRERSPRRRGDRDDPHEETERNENNPQRGEGLSETAWDHLSLSCSNGIHLNNSPPPDSLNVTGPARSAI